MNIYKIPGAVLQGMIGLLFLGTTLAYSIIDKQDVNLENEVMLHSEMVSETSDSNTFAKSQNKSAFVADGDTLVVKSTGTDLSYDITEIRAKAGSTITIRYENTSNMPHNVVFVNERSDIQPVGVGGLRARDTEYIPQDEELLKRIFGYTALARPGFTEYVTITVPEPGTYPYICTYPGHFTMMQGDLISE